MNSPIRILDSSAAAFSGELTTILDRDASVEQQIDAVVADIIRQVREGGDKALITLTNNLDQRKISDVDELKVSARDIKRAEQRIEPELLQAMQDSAERIRTYHEKQLTPPWTFVDKLGNRLGQLIRPIEKAGIYVPGGKASYPSSVLMTAIPARVAGVEHVTLVVPAPAGELNPSVLAAASICEVDEVITIGGAQAIAALAYGTETIERVDKIVGPGNIYVATAKKMVFGQVGIDMIAGPSEVVIIADGQANARWLVLDMFAQAEHDEQAQSILISDSSALLHEVERLVDEMLTEMPRAAIIRQALAARGALIKVADLRQAIEVSNRIAPEHLELACEGADSLIDLVRHAGAVFVGRFSAESLGDYVAGPSHVLPTAGTARFSSPLGVYDFQKRSSLIDCSRRGAVELGKRASVLARDEGLVAHAMSAECRITNQFKSD